MDVSEEGAVVPLSVCVEPVVSAAGAGVVVVFVVELLAFFFAFGVVVCAKAIEPATKNALKISLHRSLLYPSSTPVAAQRGRYNFRSTIPGSCGHTHAVVQTKYSSLLRQI